MKHKIIIGMLCMASYTYQLNAQLKIAPTFNGGNLWRTVYENAPFGSVTSLTSAQLAMCRAAGMVMMRAGGAAYNSMSSGSSVPKRNGEIRPAGYVKIVDDMRAEGLEPMVQVPFYLDKDQPISIQAAVAAEIVRQLNVVHRRNVRFFVLANEPGLDLLIYDPGNTATITEDHVRLIRDYVKKFSVEMKLIDPDIMIIGPELEWEIPFILDRLFASATTGPHQGFSVRTAIGPDFDGVGRTASIQGKFFVDYLSFHAYPGSGNSFTGNSNNLRKQTIEAEFDYLTVFQNVATNYGISIKSWGVAD